MKSIDSICKMLFTPAMLAHGWDRSTQISYVDDADFQYTDMGIEYILLYNKQFPIATLSVSNESANFKRAFSASDRLRLPIAITCNEHTVHIHLRGYNGWKHHNQMNLPTFPSPEDLLNLYYLCSTSIIYPKLGRFLLVGAGLTGGAFVSLVRYIFSVLMVENKNKDYLYLTNIHDDYFNSCLMKNESDSDCRFIILQDNIELVDFFTEQRKDTLYSACGNCYVTTINNYISTLEYINRVHETLTVIYQNSSLNCVILHNSIPDNGNEEVLATGTYKSCRQEFDKIFPEALIIEISSPDLVRKEDIDCFGAPICMDVLSYDYLLDYCKGWKVRPIFAYTYRCGREHTYQTGLSDRPSEIVVDKIIHDILNKENTKDYKKITINTDNMAKQTSYERQIELAYNLKSYLHGFQERLGDVAINYQAKSNELYETGMMEETHQAFEQKCMFETIKHIKSVIEQINEQDIPFVDKFIEELENMREKYK